MDLKEQYRAYANQWRAAAPLLQEIRDQELRGRPLDTLPQFISSMTDNYELLLKSISHPQTSGLVEFYKALQPLRTPLHNKSDDQPR